jgi:hypothetical protein
LWTSDQIIDYIEGVAITPIGASAIVGGTVTKTNLLLATDATKWAGVFRAGNAVTGDQVLLGETSVLPTNSASIFTATVSGSVITWEETSPAPSMRYYTDKNVVALNGTTVTADETNNVFFIDVGGANKTYLGKINIEIPAYTGGNGIRVDQQSIEVRLHTTSGQSTSGLQFAQIGTGTGIYGLQIKIDGGGLAIHPTNDGIGVKVKENGGLLVDNTLGTGGLYLDAIDGGDI